MTHRYEGHQKVVIRGLARATPQPAPRPRTHDLDRSMMSNVRDAQSWLPAGNTIHDLQAIYIFQRPVNLRPGSMSAREAENCSRGAVSFHPISP